MSIIDEPGIYHPSPPAVLVFTRVSVGYFRRTVFAAADELAGDRVAAWRFLTYSEATIAALRHLRIMRSGPSNSMIRCGRSLSRRSTIWSRASGQAIQNMNVLLGLPETTGLEYRALFL